MSPQHVCLWKTMGLTSRRTMELKGAEILLLNGLYTDSLTLWLSTKAVVWKAHTSHVKETHLLILQHLTERQVPVRALSEDGDSSGCHFYLPLNLTCTKTGEHHFCTLFVSPASACGCIPSLYDFHNLAPIPPPVAPPKVAGMCSPYRGCPLNAWLWGQGWLHFWAPKIWNNWRNRALNRQNTIYPNLPVKKSLLNYLYCSFCRKACFRINTHLEPLKCSENAIYVLSFDLATAFQYLSERSSYTHLEP